MGAQSVLVQTTAYFVKIHIYLFFRYFSDLSGPFIKYIPNN